MTITIKEIGGTGNVAINGTAPNTINNPGDTWNSITPGLIRTGGHLGVSSTGGLSIVNAGASIGNASVIAMNFNSVVSASAEMNIIIGAQNKTDNPTSSSLNPSYFIQVRPNASNTVRVLKNLAGTPTALGNFSSGNLSNSANITTSIQLTTSGGNNTITVNVNDGVNTPISFLNVDNTITPGPYFGIRVLNVTGGTMGNVTYDNLGNSTGFFQLQKDLNGLGASGPFFANPLI